MPELRRRLSGIAVGCSAVLSAAVFLSCGCDAGKLAGVVGSPGYEEGDFPAEYDIAASSGRILVLVNQPSWMKPGANFRFHLAERINRFLVDKAKVAPERLLKYENLAEFRSARQDFGLLSPFEVGKAMEADLVLLVELADGGLEKLPGEAYFSGSLNARAAILEVASGQRLWPEDPAGKLVMVGFEIEPAGRQAALSRLASAFAHCVTRHLYKCPKKHFKIFDDRISTSWDGSS